MSGIEIAGLVLAVIPLFISAIKDYEDHIRPVRVLNYVVYRRELARHRVKLNIEYGLYNSALEELLVDVVPQDELRDMIAQGYGSHWKDAALEERLKKRLGSVYDRYFFLMEQMQDVMARIASLLDLDIQRQGNTTGSQLEQMLLAHPPIHTPSQTAPRPTVYEFKKRLKFGFRSGHIQPLLDELGRYNNALYQYTQTSRRLEGLRSAAPKKTFTTPIHRVRECAERLHRCLGAVWSCSVHSDHIIDLQLEPRIFRSDVPDEAADERVLFSIACLDGRLLNRWHCLEVYVLAGDPQVRQNPPAKVKFAASTVASSFDPSTLPEIDCLCETVSVPRRRAHRTLCLDHNQRLLEGYPTTHSSIPGQQERNGSSTSLGEVLSGSSTSTRPRPFDRRQAYLLGLTVASSFLQLRATPWLCGSWHAKNVLFINETNANSIDFEKPYIRQVYPNCHTPQPAAQATIVDITTNDNYSCLALGIMLLEIYFREPISSRRLSTDPGPSQGFADLETAKRWFEVEEAELPSGVHKAIKFCIKCFASPDVDLQDDSFRQSVVEKVIVPLKDELNKWDA